MEQIIRYFPNLTSLQTTQFEKLQELYEFWNARINVISRKDQEGLYEKHILHSLAIAQFIQFVPGTKILDVGCGGGFPVIPLAIMFPDVQFTAVDSIGKKIMVVKEISDALGLKNINPIHARAESIKDKFDFIVSRAVAPTIMLLGWTKGMISGEKRHNISNGYLLLKGGDLKEELLEAHERYQFRHQEISLSRYFDTPFFETKKLIYIHP